ncbi:hypothetical protein [Cupriavidus basilensis]|uniref:hypothetical protein n=1 Tax=Cupriavidus basilensis TaxID=68895 RepID=UPI0039F6C2F2
MFAVTYQAASILLETQFLPGDTAELRLDCEGITGEPLEEFKRSPNIGGSKNADRPYTASNVCTAP